MSVERLQVTTLAKSNKPQCPRCDSQQVLYRAKDDTYGCRRCGHRWAKPSEQDEFPIRVTDVQFFPAKKRKH